MNSPSTPAPVVSEPWRVGRRVPIHVYEGERPLGTFLTAEDAARAVAAVNATRAPVVSAEDMREKIALTVYLGNYHNADHAGVTKAWREGQYAYCEAKYYRIADALLSPDGPIAEMQAEHQREVERIRTLYEEQLDHAHYLLNPPVGKEGE